MVPADRLLLPVGQPGYVRAARRRAARSATVGSGGFSNETCLLYLAALGVFFATPPDTSRLLIIANSARHGMIILICKVIRGCRRAHRDLGSYLRTARSSGPGNRQRLLPRRSGVVPSLRRAERHIIRTASLGFTPKTSREAP